MIIDGFVEVKWHSINKKHYTDKGYVFSKMGNFFTVNVNDLKHGSHVMVRVMCDVCEKERNVEYCEYLRNISNYDYFACSMKCSMQKRTKTNLIIFGVENVFQNKKIRKKADDTIILRYGTKYASQNIDIKKKVEKTNLERLGCACPFQNEEVKNKMKVTNLEKYGCENASQAEEVKTKRRETLKERYGVDHPSKYKKFTEKATRSTIERYGELWLKHIPRYNSSSILYLDMISELIGLPIQHALNGGEKKFIRYWSDGYVELYNLCIEWDEVQHINDDSTLKRDIKKDLFMKENFGCIIIRINEKEFLKDIDNRIGIICDKINRIILEIETTSI